MFLTLLESEQVKLTIYFDTLARLKVKKRHRIKHLSKLGERVPTPLGHNRLNKNVA
jgi:hypothetical protein